MSDARSMVGAALVTVLDHAGVAHAARVVALDHVAVTVAFARRPGTPELARRIDIAANATPGAGVPDRYVYALDAGSLASVRRLLAAREGA